MLELRNTFLYAANFDITRFGDSRILLLGFPICFPHFGLLAFSFPREMYQSPK